MLRGHLRPMGNELNPLSRSAPQVWRCSSQLVVRGAEGCIKPETHHGNGWTSASTGHSSLLALGSAQLYSSPEFQPLYLLCLSCMWPSLQTSFLDRTLNQSLCCYPCCLLIGLHSPALPLPGNQGLPHPSRSGHPGPWDNTQVFSSIIAFPAKLLSLSLAEKKFGFFEVEWRVSLAVVLVPFLLTEFCWGMWATASIIVSPQSRDVQQGRMEKFRHAFMKAYQILPQWEKSFNGKNVPPALQMLLIYLQGSKPLSTTGFSFRNHS